MDIEIMISSESVSHTDSEDVCLIFVCSDLTELQPGEGMRFLAQIAAIQNAEGFKGFKVP